MSQGVVNDVAQAAGEVSQAFLVFLLAVSRQDVGTEANMQITLTRGKSGMNFTMMVDDPIISEEMKKVEAKFKEDYKKASSKI